MNDFIVAGASFVVIVLGTFAGVGLRAAIPPHHRESESKDVVRLGMGLVATMAALVLGLLIATAKSTFDDQRQGVEQMAAKLVLLDQTLRLYGPAAEPIRLAMAQSVSTTVDHIWPRAFDDAPNLFPEGTGTQNLPMFTAMVTLVPESELQRNLQQQALARMVGIAETRWLLIAQFESGGPPMLLIAIMTFWFAVLFGSFGLFAPMNGTVAASLGLAGLAVDGAVYLVLDLAGPFTGLIRVPSASLVRALGQIMQ